MSVSRTTTFIVQVDPAAAFLDLAKISSRAERTALLNVVEKLRQLGPQLVPPHAKPLKGQPDLWELRPRQGRSPSRAVFRRSGDGYVILAFSKDHASDMDDAIAAACERASRHP